MLIRVQNNLDVNAPFTFFSVSKAAAVGTINVKNAAGFSANWAVQIGKTGEEKSEIKVLGTATPSGTSLLLSGTTVTSFEHPSDTPVYAIKWDKIVFEKSTTGTAGVASPITNGTISITPDSVFTQFDDTAAAGTADAYRTYFLNSVTLDASSESDWITSDGFSFYSLAKIRERIKGKLFSSKFLKDDGQINDWINEWLEVMNNAIISVDKSYTMGTTSIAFGTAGYGTISVTDYRDLKRMWITYDGVNRYRAGKRDLSETFPNETFNEAHPFYEWQGDDIFKVLPSTTAGTAELTYYKRAPVLVNDTDEIPFAMRSYTNSFVNYGLAEAYFNDDKDEKGRDYLGRAMSDKQLLITQSTPRDYTGVVTMEITNSVNGEDDDFYF